MGVSAPTRRGLNRPLLRRRLEALVRTFDRRYLDSDPLGRVLRFRDDDDREIGGFFAAALAYGNVKQILASLDGLYTRMDGRPAAFVRGYRPARDARRLSGFRHRWTGGRDIADLCGMLRAALAEHGTLGALFAKCRRPGEPTVRDALARFVTALRRYAPRLPAKAGARYLLSSPEDGSACKRMNLYLRWMVRGGDGIDCGLWRDVPASALVIPLDTHVARIGGFLGLTHRKTPDWKMAEEITGALRGLHPADPVRYDFAISRLGILDRCPKHRHPPTCAACTLFDLCTA